MLVVFGEIVGDARQPRVDVGAAELLGGDFLAGRRLHERRAAEEDRPGAPDDDGLVRHRGHVGAARRAGSHDDGDLRDAFGRHPRLIEEDAPEVVAVGEDLGLQRQERAARVHQIDAGQAVLQRDFLRADVLLDRDRIVGAALDGRVVGDDQHLAARHAADAGDDAGGGRLVVVQVPGGERRQLEEGRAGVEQLADPLADRQLALLPVPLEVLFAAALADGAVRSRSSATSAAIRSWLRRNSSAAGSIVSLEPVHQRAGIRDMPPIIAVMDFRTNVRYLDS